MKRDDLLPVVEVVATSGGTTVNLTGATSPRFLMRLMSAADLSTPKIDGVATIPTPSAGTLRYDWAGTDTDTAGIYSAEFEVTIGGKKRTFRLPNLVIEPNIWTEPVAAAPVYLVYADDTAMTYEDDTAMEYAA